MKNSRVKITPDEITRLTQDQNLLTVQSYDLKNRTIVIIGEDHSLTRTQFGSDFIKQLNDWCHKTDKITCLIEKHIASKKDKVQKTLMCNMPHMAIHRFRCDQFLETHKCKNLNIIPVDNRHYDLGFIRMEIFQVWKECPKFQSYAVEFHKQALERCDLQIGRKVLVKIKKQFFNHDFQNIEFRVLDTWSSHYRRNVLCKLFHSKQIRTIYMSY